MKKLFILAAFGVAGLVSAKNAVENKIETKAKAKTEVKAKLKSPKQTCGVTITYYSGGQVVGSQVVTSDQPDLPTCQKWQNGVKFALQIAGFWTI